MSITTADIHMIRREAFRQAVELLTKTAEDYEQMAEIENQAVKDNRGQLAQRGHIYAAKDLAEKAKLLRGQAKLVGALK